MQSWTLHSYDERIDLNVIDFFSFPIAREVLDLFASPDMFWRFAVMLLSVITITFILMQSSAVTYSAAINSADIGAEYVSVLNSFSNLDLKSSTITR